MKYRLLFLLLLFPHASLAADCAIVLHGVLRDAFSMRVTAVDLQKAGYIVINDGYPSTSATIEELAENTISQAIAKCPKDARVNFVTHSMGGILVRAYYKTHQDQKPNRVVMIAPPNQGSEVIDDQLFEWFGSIAGKSGAELSTSPDSFVNKLGAVDYPVGVIAGNGSINPLFSDIIPGDDDGAVSVARTHVKGETDWVLAKFNHSFGMNNQTVRQQVIAFLQNGVFTD